MIVLFSVLVRLPVISFIPCERVPTMISALPTRSACKIVNVGDYCVASRPLPVHGNVDTYRMGAMRCANIHAKELM